MDTFDGGTGTNRYVQEFNDAGGLTLFQTFNDDTLKYQVKNTYQSNLVYLKTRYNENLEENLQTTVESFDQSGQITQSLTDIGSDGTANYYTTFEYTNDGHITSRKGFQPVSFTYDPVSYETTISDTNPTLEYDETFTYDANGNLISDVRSSTVDCRDAYECSNVTFTYEYVEGLLTSYEEVQGGDGGYTKTTTQEFHENSDMVKKRTFEQDGLNAYTQIREYNIAGQNTLDNYDAVNDNGTHRLYTYSYNSDFFILQSREASSLSDIQTETYAGQTFTYDENNLLTNVLSDWDGDGIAESEYALTYENGLLVEWIDYDIDPNTEVKTVSGRETYSYTASNFNYASN